MSLNPLGRHWFEHDQAETPLETAARLGRHHEDAMTTFLVLLRGINVGGKNKVPMAPLRELLEELGYHDVSTYIASGNVILRSDRPAARIKREIEAALPKRFRLDSAIVAVRVLTHTELRSVVEKKPKGFGEQPATYHSDAIFLIGVDATKAMEVFDPHPDVDAVWPGDGVIYSQRLSAQRTKSRLNKAITTPLYQSMTIRSWSTTLALLERMDAGAAAAHPQVHRDGRPTIDVAHEGGTR
jgi:uncharacterized protein (DUF1697 family)